MRLRLDKKSTSLITPIDHQGESESETGYPSQSVDGCVVTNMRIASIDHLGYTGMGQLAISDSTFGFQ